MMLIVHSSEQQHCLQERRIRYPGDIRIEAAEIPVLDSADLESADGTDSSREDRWGIEC